LKLKINVDGKVYEVDVEVSEPDTTVPSYLPPMQARVPAAAPVAAVPTAPAAASESVADESKVCRSPLAGVVSKVNVQVGQTIQVNDVLLVLEAMKMETVITAPREGKVAKINAAVGDGVKQNQVLVEFD
jgi:methylmalonyl-CoA carboxyltransferase small subunit